MRLTALLPTFSAMTLASVCIVLPAHADVGAGRLGSPTGTDTVRLAQATPIATSLPSAPVQSSQSWEISRADKTLKSAITRWAETSGWQLSWELAADYAIEADTHLTGTFEEAIESVARSLETADVPVNAIFYKGNKVLRIVAKGTK